MRYPSEEMIAICDTGIHIGQLKLMIAQADETVALAQKWLEQMHHLADHGGLTEASTSVAQATVLLGEARAKLKDAIDASDRGSEDGVSVERV